MSGLAMTPLSHLLDDVRGLRWPSRRRVSGALPGVHDSRRRGMSPELSEFRAYRQGDDPRQLDWKLLARTDRAYVRLAEERSILPTIFVLDASASMDFPSGAKSKWTLAVTVTIGLAAVAHASGDPVGLIVPTASGEILIPPRTRRGVVDELARALGVVRPEGSPALDDAMRRTGNARRIVLVSDFLGREPELTGAALALAQQGREVCAIHVVAERELDPGRDTRMVVDPEDPSLRRPLSRESVVDYRAEFDAWRAALARAWRLRGASFTEVVTSEPPARLVRRIVSA